MEYVPAGTFGGSVTDANEQDAGADNRPTSLPVQPSLADRVLDELFKRLEARAQFNETHIKELRSLRAQDQLRKAASVKAAVETSDASD